MRKILALLAIVAFFAFPDARMVIGFASLAALVSYMYGVQDGSKARNELTQARAARLELLKG